MEPDLNAVEIPLPRGGMFASLAVPDRARGLIIFAHGSGSSRHSPRNRAVAHALQERGFATLLADLLTPEEEHIDHATARVRFDVDLLVRRVVALIDWARRQPHLQTLPIGLFGASTGAAAALGAAAARPWAVSAVVSRGGRPDLAGASLPAVESPTLLLVGSLDTDVITVNQWAQLRMKHCQVSLKLIAGASHLFEEPGMLEHVASKAAEWFSTHLGPEIGASDRPAGTVEVS
jgi:dienelactone hydrolase